MQETEVDLDNTPLSKPKKPRSEKQIKAFETVMQKRAENIAKKKELKLVESAKLLLSKQVKQPKIIATAESESEPESERLPSAMRSIKEPEPLPIKMKSKKQSKPKMKSRKKIIIESSSESESESESSSSSESETEFIIKSRSKKSKYKQPTQISRVKRSDIIPEMTHNHPAPKTNVDYYNFFV